MYKVVNGRDNFEIKAGEEVCVEEIVSKVSIDTNKLIYNNY